MSKGPLDDFGFGSQSARPLTPAEKDMNVFLALKRNDLFTIGGRKLTYKIFKSEGSRKYATIHGTSGRKFYAISVTAFDPFQVGAFEVVSSSEEKKTPHNGTGLVQVVGVAEERDR
jgi:hypothetical protein